MGYLAKKEPTQNGAAAVFFVVTPAGIKKNFLFLSFLQFVYFFVVSLN